MYTISLLHTGLLEGANIIRYEKHFINYKELIYLLSLNKIKKTVIKRTVRQLKINCYLLSESGMGFERPRFTDPTVFCLIVKFADQC